MRKKANSGLVARRAMPNKPHRIPRWLLQAECDESIFHRLEAYCRNNGGMSKASVIRLAVVSILDKAEKLQQAELS